jgi:hypothetical protein
MIDNSYATRRRKRPDKDVPICMCQPVPGMMGCGESCMNRIGHVECTAGFCHLGESCSNQAMQRGMWKKVQIVDAGPRGSGLRILEEARPGEFVIEYCGEIINMEECLKRQEAMAGKGEADVYFLATGPDDMIDARRKGSLARFINHSCNPNCKTQKWTVANETKIAILAIKHLAPGTELTFDYQFERFGSSSQKCFCGEANCRGILGAKGDLEVQRLQKEKQGEGGEVADNVVDAASDRERRMFELIQERLSSREDHLVMAEDAWKSVRQHGPKEKNPFLERNRRIGWRARHALIATHVAELELAAAASVT